MTCYQCKNECVKPLIKLVYEWTPNQLSVLDFMGHISRQLPRPEGL